MMQNDTTRFGSGGHVYELVDGWADLPDDESFLDIGSVCIDENDRVFVLNRGDSPVVVFDTAGSRLSSWGEGYFSDRPHGMGIGPDSEVYCTDDGNHTVQKFTPNGDHLTTLGSEDEPSDTGVRRVPNIFEQVASITRSAGPFNGPTDVTVFDSGELFVTDGYGNARVHRFTPGAKLVESWGEPGADPREFRLPHSVHHDDENRIWVTDRENSRIQIFDADGEFLEEWTDLIRPTDLFIDDGTVYVSELCRRISVFTLEGELLTRWGNGDYRGDEPLFVAPHAIAVDSSGDVYVGEVPYSYENIDRGARTLQKFERVD